jgi:hypothetical protein
MASKRAIRRKSCKGKIAYAERADAERTALHQNRQRGDYSLVAYYCKFCSHWHVGHATHKVMRILHLRGVR